MIALGIAVAVLALALGVAMLRVAGLAGSLAKEQVARDQAEDALRLHAEEDRQQRARSSEALARYAEELAAAEVRLVAAGQRGTALSELRKKFGSQAKPSGPVLPTGPVAPKGKA